MFKALLYVCVSLLSFHGLCQSPPLERSGSAEAVVEGSDRIIDGLSCTAENGNILLTWKVRDSVPDFFVIERSDNGETFETVTIINNLETKPSYQWTDEAPRKGKSFYRIRYSYHQGQPMYSKMVSYYIAGNLSYKFYPNPVDHILIVRSDSPIDVQITDNNGRVRITEPKVEGLHTINVSALEKGIYLIRFINKLTNVMSQEKLVKN